MKTTLVISFMLLLFQVSQAQNDIEGIWKMAENETEIEIKKDGDVYTGTVVKSEAEKAIGKVVLQDFKKDGEVWKGKFYAVKRDRLVDATLKESGDSGLEMEVNAGRRSRTITMTRAN